MKNEEILKLAEKLEALVSSKEESMQDILTKLTKEAEANVNYEEINMLISEFLKGLERH